jgi:hypothetical protein
LPGWISAGVSLKGMSESNEGEVLKASGPTVQVDMEVSSLDGQPIGKVKEIRGDAFLLARPLARGVWVPLSAVLATEDYTANYRGPVQPTVVVLTVTEANLDYQGWRHA